MKRLLVLLVATLAAWLGAGAAAPAIAVPTNVQWAPVYNYDGVPEDHTAATVAAAITTTFATLPQQLRRSLTWDQGKEMSLHVQVATATGMPVFFADPHSPWQRGTNENTNGLIREYFPKGTDLSIHDPEELAYVAAEINGRPRKRLNWETPAEAFQRLLSETASVANTP